MLENGVYTHNSRKSSSARLAWWQARAGRRGMAPWPLDEAKLKLAGALLKHGSYRSAAQNLYTLKKKHVDTGAEWTPKLQSAFKDVKRSCERGLGGSKQADALPLAKARGPVPYEGKHLRKAKLALLVSCWWMLREIELANILKANVRIEEGRGCGVASLNISASKTDGRAKGTWRHQGCACPSKLCPAKALRNLWTDTEAWGPKAPLVVTTAGVSPTEAQVVDEIVSWAVYLQAPQGNYTGHALRTTGAQRLAMAGVSEAKIRMFGRWASEAMLRYVRESLLAQSGIVVAKQVEDDGKQ